MQHSRSNSTSKLSQLKKVAIRLREEIPKLKGKEKTKAIETYSVLLSGIMRLEK